MASEDYQAPVYEPTDTVRILHESFPHYEGNNQFVYDDEEYWKAVSMLGGIVALVSFLGVVGVLAYFCRSKGSDVGKTNTHRLLLLFFLVLTAGSALSALNGGLMCSDGLNSVWHTSLHGTSTSTC